MVLSVMDIHGIIGNIFYYKDNKYCITGDGYYQNYCEITKYD